jgi:phage shock protein A
MKSLLFWLMGDRAGRTMVATWHWLWGKPLEGGGKIAVEVAQESLYSMQNSVHQLAASVAKVVAAQEKAKLQYQQKQKEAKQAESQATLAQVQGNEEGARLAMARAIEIERVLPRLAEQVEQANRSVSQLQGKLKQERQKLETYKIQMQNLKAIAEVNEALSVITEVNGELDSASARNQFEQAQSAIAGRNLELNAFAELSENPQEKLQGTLDQMTLDDEINQRLHRLSASQTN